MSTTLTTVIRGKSGLHIRPVSLLVQLSARYQSTVTVAGGGKQASLKSMLGLMSLGLQKGSEVQVTAEGPDAEAAIRAVAEILEREDL